MTCPDWTLPISQWLLKIESHEECYMGGKKAGLTSSEATLAFCRPHCLVNAGLRFSGCLKSCKSLTTDSLRKKELEVV